MILFPFSLVGLFHVACRLTAENQAQADALALQQKHKQLSRAKEQKRKMYLCLCDAAVGGGASRKAEVSTSDKNQKLLDGGVEGVHPDWSLKRKKVQIDWRRGRSHGIGEQTQLDQSSAPPQIPGAADLLPSVFPSLHLSF